MAGQAESGSGDGTRIWGTLSELENGAGKRVGHALKSERAVRKETGTARIQPGPVRAGPGPRLDRDWVSRNQSRAGREGEATGGTRTGSPRSETGKGRLGAEWEPTAGGGRRETK